MERYYENRRRCYISKNRHALTRGKIILFSLFVTIISSFFLLQILGKRLSPILYRYLNVENKRFASNVVNYAVNEILSEELEEDLFEIVTGEEGEIQILDYNTKKVNQILKKITEKIQYRLQNLEDGKTEGLNISDSFKVGKFTKLKNGVLCEIPMGSLRGNSLFINIGPTIPVRMTFLGQVQSNLNTKVSSYGINNLVLEVNVHVMVEEQISMPTMSKSATIELEAPLTMKIIQGKVPEYYLEGIDKNSNIYSLPMKNKNNS